VRDEAEMIGQGGKLPAGDHDHSGGAVVLTIGRSQSGKTPWDSADLQQGSLIRIMDWLPEGIPPFTRERSAFDLVIQRSLISSEWPRPVHGLEMARSPRLRRNQYVASMRRAAPVKT
jgi:hypothetical protein